MNWTWYLFGFKGRINRAKYWLAGLIIICWMIFLTLLLFVPIGYLFGWPERLNFGLDNIFAIFDPATFRGLSSSELGGIIVNIITMPLYLWVFCATSVKRLHDRDRSGWWMVPFFVVPGLYKQFAERLPDSYLVLPLALIAFVLCLWGFVELYFLSGSRKTNRFGPNPLLPVQTEKRWEQHKEIEMVPHKAGPPPIWRVKPGA